MGTCLSPGDIIQHYRIEELLNDGAYALAYRAVDILEPKEATVFLKQYKSPSCRSPWYQGYVRYEREIRRRIESSTLSDKTCHFLDFFESADSRQLFRDSPGHHAAGRTACRMERHVQPRHHQR